MSTQSIFSRKPMLLPSLLLAASLPWSIAAQAQQEVPVESEARAAVAEAEAAADLDITLQVVEDAESAQDLLNNIELPEEVREIAEQKLAAALAAIKAAREMQSQGGGATSADQEALLAEMAERRGEMMAGAQASALAANEQAQQAVESAREAVEEALKNGLTNAEMQGMIEQMMQDIMGSLPEEARGNMGDMDALLDSLRGDVAADATDGTGG
ncbi:hypothetical protein [Microbulbifer sp. MCCC 1A16149]|uniref:hypothetical protein n=1 Tax=Microbulbifer sp. MCCC 1A16149 TaxID=3411322 RepID=UPI003D127BBA